MAFLIISSGMPVPPCRTRGMLSVALWILSRASKSRPFQLAGYLPWMLPIPAARKSMPREAILRTRRISDLAHADDAVLFAADGADLGLDGQAVVMCQRDQLGGLGDVLVDGVVAAIEHDGGETGGDAGLGAL